MLCRFRCFSEKQQLTVINYQFIISSDQDLLTMHRFEGIDIVTVQEFAVHTV